MAALVRADEPGRAVRATQRELALGAVLQERAAAQPRAPARQPRLLAQGNPLHPFSFTRDAAAIRSQGCPPWALTMTS